MCAVAGKISQPPAVGLVSRLPGCRAKFERRTAGLLDVGVDVDGELHKADEVAARAFRADTFSAWERGEYAGTRFQARASVVCHVRQRSGRRQVVAVQY